MKITYILKDKSQQFYEGFPPSIIGFNTLSNADKFNRCESLRRDSLATCKVGNSDSFRDKVELNSILKSKHSIEFKLEPRNGYKLATFDIEPIKE